MKKRDLFIKVLSLGIGLAVGIVLIAKVCYELSYDKSYPDAERIYRIRTKYTHHGELHDYYNVSGAVPFGFKSEVPGVEEGTRTTSLFSNENYVLEDGSIVAARLVLADSCFFNIFDRPALAGDLGQALAKSYTAVVSRSFAEKMGGVAQCIGKTLFNEDAKDLKFTVEGVYEDFPENGTFDYDILLSMESFSKQSTENWMGNDRYQGYVKLSDGVDPHSLDDAIRKMQEKHQPIDEIEKMGTSLWYYLTPFDKMHTSDPEVKNTIRVLSVVAFLLVVISVLNYILVVISSMVKRSREVGVMKCYGAEGKNIYGMLSREAAVHILLSLFIAAALVFAGRGVVENLLGVSPRTLMIPQSIAVVCAVLFVVLAISIVVPARLYMRVPVYAALKNYTENSRRWKMILLGVQVFINVFMLSLLLVVSRQYDALCNADPGYKYDNLYFIGLYDGDKDAQKRVVEVLRQMPSVKGVEACYALPFEHSSGDNVWLPDKDIELFNIADQYEATEGFYELLGVKFIAGRAPRDSSEVAVSESFVKKMSEFADWSSGAVGKVVDITGHNYAKQRENGAYLSGFTVSGVYNDMRIGSLVEGDERPSARFYGSLDKDYGYMPYILIKVQEMNSETYSRLTDAVSKALDGRNVKVHSYAESMRKAYEDSRKMRNTIFAGALVTLLVAILGLIGFVRDESQRRSKEMAIRKINGASAKDIHRYMQADIIRISAIVAVLASAAAFLIARKWLEQFAERISLSPIYFLVAAAVVILVVIAVVAISSLRIVNSNPIESLKNE